MSHQAVSVSQVVLRSRQLEIEAARHLASRAELVDVIGQLIDVLQRERGSSSIYLASQGQRFDQVRQASVAEARQVEARLRALFAAQIEPSHGASARMLSLIASSLLGLDALEELRNRIDRRTLTALESVAAFSRLIAGLVELIFHVADATLLPGASRLLVALLHLVQGKEAAGQERALGALLFASGLCDEAHQQRVVHLIEAQERNLQVLSTFLDPDQRTRLEQQQLTSVVAKLERLRRTLCTARPGAALDSNLSDTWFDVCSERIRFLRELQTELVARLQAECEAQIREAQQDLLDSEGLLRRLRANPPAHTHAVERFFDIGARPAAVPELLAAAGASPAASAESTSMHELLQAQSTRLAQIEAELAAARRALDDRKIVDRAKVVLMSRLGLSEEAALRALQKASMQENRRLPEVAEAALTLLDVAFATARDKPAGDDADAADKHAGRRRR
jgi:hypothetical protein